jgi:murein DD-endopeptidase MepM/ murein hydrolase activator NlpD
MYILYAHLENPPEFMLGDQVGCGDVFGSIGDSGNALAPHLHVEMRYGYSAGIVGSMAHYDVSADEQEMSNYCRWRVSGLYRIIDPMELLFTTTGSTSD